MYMCVRACVTYKMYMCVRACVCACACVCVFLDGEGSRVVVSSIDGHVSDQLQ